MSASKAQDVVMEEVQRAALSLIFNPEISRPIFKSASILAGVIYPTYCSYRALETKYDNKDDIQWLTYWTIYATFSLVEHYLDEKMAWVPYIYHAKLLFLLWLQLPVTRGATLLYEEQLEPVLKKYQPKIDLVLQFWYNKIGWVLDSPLVKTLYEQSEKYVGQGIDAVVWFVKDQSNKQNLALEATIKEEEEKKEKEKEQLEFSKAEEVEHEQAELKEGA
eukprot:TRINITY_DN1037_c0_g1_i1.p1 TRINITY_DN1037_c0_g1~~TRINITY_DN1037_c0_g1_i1.p1  ORF type:complete len:220 (+),score=28.44 TRINITY_DN1037_c0_g1_i1:91-750(+)